MVITKKYTHVGKKKTTKWVIEAVKVNLEQIFPEKFIQ